VRVVALSPILAQVDSILIVREESVRKLLRKEEHMKHQNYLNAVTSLVSALQHHVQARYDAALYDISASVEVLVCEIYRITDDLNLKNKNQISVTFPAIDLADDANRVAMQVTANVTTQKWKETENKFNAHGLRQHYDHLYIVGFCKAVRPKQLPGYISVEGPSEFLGKIRVLPTSALAELERLLRESYDFSMLSPLRDEDCFGVVLKVLDRDAIRHVMCVEGSYDDMAQGLKEIREIIMVGQISNKNIFAKPATQYTPPYSGVLAFIDLNISRILAELNKSRRGHHYYLTERQSRFIDITKREIISEVNAFCERLGRTERISRVPR
jgi:hypothetical protein